MKKNKTEKGAEEEYSGDEVEDSETKNLKPLWRDTGTRQLSETTE